MRISKFTAGLRNALVILILGAGTVLGCSGDRNEWQQPDRVMNDLNLKPGSRIADIGCGDGYFALRFARAVGGQGVVFAVDINKNSLESLKKRAAQENLANIAAVVSEPVDVKLEPGSVDAVFFCDVLHEVAESRRLPLVQNSAQALKPGGFLFIIDYRKSREVTCDSYEVLVPREELEKFGLDAGLKLDAEFHYLKYQVFLRFRKPEK